VTQELAWRQQMLDEKEHELNRIEETLAEKERSLKAAVDAIQKGLEYLQIQVKQKSENIETERNKLQRARQAVFVEAIEPADNMTRRTRVLGNAVTGTTSVYEGLLISVEGSRWLRWIAVESAHAHLKYDCQSLVRVMR
jgi:Skp family chaperone for outer membrane proteins